MAPEDEEIEFFLSDYSLDFLKWERHCAAKPAAA